MSESGISTITDKTRVPLGWIIAVLTGILGIAVAAIFWAANVDASLRSLQSTMSKVEAAVNASDKWTRPEHDAFALSIRVELEALRKQAQEQQIKLIQLEASLKGRP